MAPVLVGTKSRRHFLERIRGNMELDNEVKVEEDVISQSVDKAADWHSNYRPRITLWDLTGDGTNEYDLPDNWEQGFSTIRHIEYPTGEESPVLLDRDEALIWYTGVDPNGLPVQRLRFRHTHIASGEQALVQYTTRHQITADLVTVPDHEFEAVCHLGTFHAAMEIAGRLIKDFSDNDNNTFNVVNYRHTSDLFKNYAQEMFTMYCRRIGISTEMGVVEPYLRIFDLDPGPAYGQDYLTHGGFFGDE